MTIITFEQQRYELQDDESLLDCLLRHNINYPCSCRSGVCQSCIAQLVDGKIEPAWQKGLRDTHCAKKYFLPCLAKPKCDIAFASTSLNEICSPAVIQSKYYLNNNVMAFHILVDPLQQWIPGQYVNLINPDGCRRSYSIANIPELDGYIELHIKIIPNGLMSEWLVHHAHEGVAIQLQGPMGDCFYFNPTQAAFPMILAGTGTGLAPLLGITRDALRHQHTGTIHLIHGGVCEEDLYLDATLQELNINNDSLCYESCVLHSDGIHQTESIDKVLLRAISDPINTRVYVCGPADTTKKLKLCAFLAGVPSANIYSDTFIDSRSKTSIT